MFKTYLLSVWSNQMFSHLIQTISQYRHFSRWLAMPRKCSTDRLFLRSNHRSADNDDFAWLSYRHLSADPLLFDREFGLFQLGIAGPIKTKCS